MYVFSSDFVPKNTNKGKTKGKGKGKGKKGKKGTTWESAGVGFCMNPAVTGAIKDIYQISSRICTILFRAAGRCIAITSAYAPQSLRPQAENKKYTGISQKRLHNGNTWYT